MKKVPQKNYLNAIIFVTMVLVIGVVAYTFIPKSSINLSQFIPDELQVEPEVKEVVEIKPQKPEAPEHVKGIYITAYTTTLESKLDYLINLINDTELNAVVLDIKDYTGKVLYDSDVEMVNTYQLEKDILGDVPALIKKLHDNDIYVIARQTVFQDPILAEKNSELAFKKLGGGAWRDYKGLAWVNSSDKVVWDYNVAIAKEAIALGFDEINFDYVRFPSDGNLRNIIFTHGEKEKHDVMREFYTYLNTELQDEPAYISVDLFGFVMERHDGINIGQRLEDAVDNVDFISPMMYPSHYPNGHLGISNPAASPYPVIDNGMKKGMPYFEGKRAKVRPWIQAFNIGAYYGAKNIRAQIDAIEKYDNAGWLLWNASNRYSAAGLEESVEGKESCEDKEENCF